ncbi:ferritin-like domain-containing protein [Sporolactobacillus kofuensis]|uniref:Ferritin-like domain-containing protein n=1 Tax=Sporolactobacillus kofuensis TaxID=269672 RepID=A0ABW1WFU7_9BACL|nr:ferritin-like domain-containing protein [Sporolactobacillus kofuensis]MCO7175791.1 ferritin-like domain-containing protein [Sporolactobacillus kofuensis]
MYDAEQFYRQSAQEPMNPLIAQILGSIKGEATGVDFYTRLAAAAPTPEMRNAILANRRDEEEHFRLFSGLYARLTGQQPVYQITPVQFSSFREGLKIAYRDELEDYEKYRNYYLMTQDPMLRDVFLRAFTDEIKHAIRVGFMETSLSE